MIEKKYQLPELTMFDIKILALCAMLIDHAGAIFFAGSGELYWLMRAIGRAFPLFAFMLAEGFIHTRDKKKYLKRLAFLAVVSEIPFDLAFHGTLYYPGLQNTVLTLTICLLMLMALDGISGDRNSAVWFFKAGAIVFLACVLTVIFKMDYAIWGPVLTAVFWMFRNDRKKMLLFGFLSAFLSTYQIFGVGALYLIPIGMYSGKRGRKIGAVPYLIYPVHLMVFALIQMML